ncbi:Crp/Fnr family transcriptional regulator [Konateibacter massiliensis]|uniref:Crp/Fnr family transcriptional regulator n=1 Tax=Konateibacter massiliensis TaxID=2002841 RepID=UPI000C15F162|nr:Crp/Fnr family transcriptional regulator [Konateibacter massiliensis]
MLDNEAFNYVTSRLDFWDKLNEEEKNILQNNTTNVVFSKGSKLYSTNNECLGVLLVHSGELRVYILSEDGRDITLYRILEGELCVLSASCVLNSITFDVEIEAEQDTEAYLINIGAFSKLTSQNVYVENFAYKNAIERFSDVMWSMEQILFMKFDRRLAIFLLDEMAKTNSSDLTITQEQIAKYVGSAREVVSRMLKVFQSQGILEQSRGSIRILDRDKLMALI